MLCSCGSDKATGNKAVDMGGDEIVAMAQAAAKQIASCDITDTLAVQTAIMEARAQHSEFSIAGDDEAATAYDAALKDELKKLNAQLCDTIFAK